MPNIFGLLKVTTNAFKKINVQLNKSLEGLDDSSKQLDDDLAALVRNLSVKADE